MGDLFFRPEPVAWVQGALGEGWVGVAEAVGVLGSTWGVVLAGGLVLWLAGRGTLWALLALAVVEGLARKGISLAAGVPRPSHPSIVVHHEIAHSSSFPSGHVSSGATLLAWVAAVTPVPAVAAGLAIALLAVARLYLGVHYLDDVVGGAALGVGLALAWRRVWPRVRAAVAGRERAVATGVLALAVVGALAAAAFWIGDVPMQWNGVAVALALAVALPAEWRWVRFSPPEGGGWRRCAVGLAGVLPFLVAERVAGGADALALGAVLVVAGTLWALLGAPWLFVRLGWSADGG